MKTKFLSAVLFLMFFIVSCGSADQKSEGKPAQSISGGNRPEWTKIPEKIEKADAFLFVGEASNANSEDDAVSIASQSAFAKVSNSFGVSVKSEFKSHEVEKDGEYSYVIGVKNSLTGQQIEVKKYHIQDKFVECLHARRECNAFVLLSVPKTEMARIKIEVDGFGIWALKSDIPEVAENIRKLFPIFNQKGIKFNQKIDFDNAEDITEVFATYQKAFLFKIECSEIKSDEYNGEFYSVIEIKAELFNLLTKETINRWTIESKGAAYSKSEAVSNGIKKAVQEIIDQI